jgi:hypothetical protein
MVWLDKRKAIQAGWCLSCKEEPVECKACGCCLYCCDCDEEEEDGDDDDEGQVSWHAASTQTRATFR